jgi:hypothetical protein
MEATNVNELLTNLSGNALAIATFVFFIRYFITKESQRERAYEAQQAHRDEYFGRIIEQNTQALKELKAAIGSVKCYALKGD